MELLSTKGFGCLKQSINQQSTAMTVCLVCISMLQKISIEELNSIRLFLSNLEENKVHYMIIGTKLDGILNKFENEEMETQKMVYVDEWCSFIMKELGIKDRSQIMCLQNYSCFQKQKIINSEVVNFYALNLLQKCIKKSEEYELEKKKLGKKSFWLCSC